MRRVSLVLAVFLALLIILLVKSSAWAIWHFPSVADPGADDLIPLALAAGAVITVEAALFRQFLQGTESPLRWSRAYFLAASSVALMIVVGEYVVPASATGVGRAVATAVVNLVVQSIVLRWASPRFVKTQVGVRAIGQTLLVPSVLPALLPWIFPGLYQ